MGLLVVPLAYLTVWELVKSTTAALVAATIVLCGEGNINSFRPSLSLIVGEERKGLVILLL